VVKLNSTCVGCINYDLYSCQSDGTKMKFPGRGCEFWFPKEERYEPYDHEEWLKENKMCDE